MNEYIQRYCSIGWRIFPVEIYLKDGKVLKKPLITDWINKATNDYDKAIELFKPFSNCQIGVATGKGSGITVVDVDVKNGKNGFHTLDAMGIEIPPTIIQTSPSGGKHLFFKYTDELRNSVSTIESVDVRNDGGFIVIEPSIFPDGSKYEFNMEQEPWVIVPMIMNYNIINALKPKAKESSGPRLVPDVIKSGERNDKMFKEACSMRERGYTEEEILGNLRIFNKTRCEKPLSEDELFAITNSAGKFEQGEPKKKKTDGKLATFLKIMNKDDVIQKIFGFNEFTEDIEFIKAPPWSPLTSPGRIISDTDIISLKVYVSQKFGFEPATGIVAEAIDYEAQNFRHHPVRDHILGLKWDSRPRIDEWLINAAGCEDNAYIRAVGRKVLVAAVSRIFQPGCIFQYMLVLEGDQGIGKSRLVSILGGAWATELNITEDDKDVVEYMRGRWIIEVPEMVCVKKTEVDHLKAFITKTKDRVRLAYRRNATDFQRQSILIGTINPSGDNTYLRDDTGGRRFWPVMCTKIDIGWLTNNRDQLIAEAYEVYKQGTEELHLTDPEVQRIAKLHQDERQDEDVWFPYIQECIESLPPGEGVTIGDIADKAVNIKKDKLDKSVSIRIGKILRRLGVPHKRIGKERIRTYFVEKNHQNMVKNEGENNW